MSDFSKEMRKNSIKRISEDNGKRRLEQFLKFEKWLSKNVKKFKPDSSVTYEALGSGSGIFDHGFLSSYGRFLNEGDLKLENVIIGEPYGLSDRTLDELDEYQIGYKVLDVGEEGFWFKGTNPIALWIKKETTNKGKTFLIQACGLHYLTLMDYLSLHEYDCFIGYKGIGVDIKIPFYSYSDVMGLSSGSNNTIG